MIRVGWRGLVISVLVASPVWATQAGRPSKRIQSTPYEFVTVGDATNSDGKTNPTKGTETSPGTTAAPANSAPVNAGTLSRAISSAPAAGGTIGIDDRATQAKLSKSPVKAEASDGNPFKKNHFGPGGAFGSGGTDRSQAFDYFFPMCVFLDPSVPNGNQLVKSLIDMAAQCRVDLVVYPRFLQPNYPRDAKMLNQFAKAKCNATDGLKSLGVNRAAVTTLVADPTIPQQMCNASGAADVTACGEFGFDPGENQKMMTANIGRFGGVADPGTAAAPIVSPASFTSAKLAGAALGQPWLGKPPGVSYGNETGDFSEAMAGAGAGSQNGWSQTACDDMRKQSFRNLNHRFRYDAEKNDYIRRDTGLKAPYDLVKATPIFGWPRTPGGSGPGLPPSVRTGNLAGVAQRSTSGGGSSVAPTITGNASASRAVLASAGTSTDGNGGAAGAAAVGSPAAGHRRGGGMGGASVGASTPDDGSADPSMIAAADAGLNGAKDKDKDKDKGASGKEAKTAKAGGAKGGKESSGTSGEGDADTEATERDALAQIDQASKDSEAAGGNAAETQVASDSGGYGGGGSSGGAPAASSGRGTASASANGVASAAPVRHLAGGIKSSLTDDFFDRKKKTAKGRAGATL